MDINSFIEPMQQVGQHFGNIGGTVGNVGDHVQQQAPQFQQAPEQIRQVFEQAPAAPKFPGTGYIGS